MTVGAGSINTTDIFLKSIKRLLMKVRQNGAGFHFGMKINFIPSVEDVIFIWKYSEINLCSSGIEFSETKQNSFC